VGRSKRQQAAAARHTRTQCTGLVPAGVAGGNALAHSCTVSNCQHMPQVACGLQAYCFARAMWGSRGMAAPPPPPLSSWGANLVHQPPAGVLHGTCCTSNTQHTKRETAGMRQLHTPSPRPLPRLGRLLKPLCRGGPHSCGPSSTTRGGSHSPQPRAAACVVCGRTLHVVALLRATWQPLQVPTPCTLGDP
jgi:hypothetical protein